MEWFQQHLLPHQINIEIRELILSLVMFLAHKINSAFDTLNSIVFQVIYPLQKLCKVPWQHYYQRLKSKVIQQQTREPDYEET